MTVNNKNEYIRISTFRKVITSLILFTFTFWGIFSGAIGVGKFQNYIHPYLFGLICGTLGMLFGILIAKRFKSYIAVTRKLRSEYWGGIFLVSVGFIGTFLLVGHYINLSLSRIENCDNYPIVEKHYHKGGRNDPPQIDLYVDFGIKVEKIKCNLYYYEKVKIGDKINVCEYSSLLGFDFFKLTDEVAIIF